MDWNQQGAPDLSEFGDVYDLKFSLGDDRPPTSVALREEYQRTILYQQCSHEVNIMNHFFLFICGSKISLSERTHHHEQHFCRTPHLHPFCCDRGRPL